MNRLNNLLLPLAGNVEDKLNNLGNDIINTWVIPIARWGAIFGLIICGIMFMAGRRNREEAKAWLPWVVGGLILVFAATFIADALIANINTF